MAHAKLSPSGSSLWLTCEGGAVLNIVDTMEKKSSSYADEGTCAHSFSELLLKSKSNRLNAYRALGKVFNGVAVNTEMIGFCLEYVDYVLSIVQDKEKDMEIEAVVPLFYSLGETGTSDVIWYDSKTKTLHIIDLKYGKGIMVYAERNSQLMIYAASWLKANPTVAGECSVVKLHICMPRLDHYDVAVMSWADLNDFADGVKDRVSLINSLCDEYYIDEPEFVFTPTDKGCQWCPRKGKCAAFQQNRFDNIKLDFDDLKEDVKTTKVTLEKKANELSLADLEMVAANATAIDGYLKAVKAEVLARMLDGEEGTILKPVLARGNRAWSDPDEADTLLKKYFKGERYKQKLLSPTQAENLGKQFDGRKASNFRKLAEELTYKPDGNPTLAKLSDKREAITPAVDDFEDLEDEGEDIL